MNIWKSIKVYESMVKSNVLNSDTVFLFVVIRATINF